MNIIINGFVREFMPVVQGLFQRLEVNRCIALNTDPVEFPASVEGEYYNWWDVKYASYSKVDWSQIPPLDRTILQEMADCEATVLKMMERLEANLGPLTYEKRRWMYQRHLRYWNYILDAQKIDLFISENIPHEVFDYVIYSLCRKKSIRTLMFYRMPTLPHKSVSRYLLEDIREHGKGITEKCRELSQKYASAAEIPLSEASRAYIDEHTPGSKKTPAAFINAGDSRSFQEKAVSKIGIGFRFLREMGLPYYWFLLQRALDRRRARRYYDQNAIEPDFAKPYIYCALHYQPEATTSPMAGEFVDQLLMIALLSHIVPDCMKIYVKEHPRTSFFRTANYYREILAMPNVQLIKSKTSTFKLIDNSVAVATGTGTAGWEAVLRLKPVLMFGYYIYQYAPRVYHINTAQDGIQAIREILQADNVPVQNEYQRNLFLKATESISIEGYLNWRYKEIATISAEENIRRTIDALVEKIRELP